MNKTLEKKLAEANEKIDQMSRANMKLEKNLG